MQLGGLRVERHCSGDPTVRPRFAQTQKREATMVLSVPEGPRQRPDGATDLQVSLALVLQERRAWYLFRQEDLMPL